VLGADSLHSLGKLVRSVAVAVVGHDTFDLDAMAGKEACRLEQEPGCCDVSLVAANLNKGQSARVVDGDVDVVVAGSKRVPSAALSEALLFWEHAMSAAGRNSTELLCVDVNQLARMLTDVADRDTGEAVMVAQPTGAMAMKNLVDGRSRQA
jgi:hypothetical protein